MKLKQIVISIENSPGRLLEVADALGKAGINLRAIAMDGPPIRATAWPARFGPP